MTCPRTARLLTVLGAAVLYAVALGTTALCGMLVAAPAQAQTAQKDELRELRERINALQKRLAASEETRAEAADSLKASERAISETNRRLYQLSAQRREAGAALTRLQNQARTLESDIAEEQAVLGKLLYRQYVGGRSDALKLVLNREDPNEIARQLQYLGYVSRARAQMLASLRDNLADLRTLSEASRKKAAELRALESEESRQKNRLVKEKETRKRVYAEVSGEISKSRKQLSTLRRDEQRLTRLIEQLTRELARKKPSQGLTNRKLPSADAGTGPFRQMKGRLRLPVIGELMNRFGSPRQDSGLSWKGLFISAKPGQEVKAIAGGRIVFADWLRGFGNLMIMDHGNGYMSLYGNNEALLKQVGDEAKVGDTIAAVGNSGGNPDSGLYFELRFQGKPFDPLPWVTLK